MAKSLVIVESPAKAKTIHKFLGRSFSVKASIGHVRDLPKSKLGVDEKHDFRPTYTVLKEKAKVVAELRKAAEAAEAIYLACDPDREGEAIAWHLAAVLPKKSKAIHRVLFNEITKSAIAKAIEHPEAIDLNKVNAQQARRILDRIVGYKLSPLLWDKVRRGLSAGRVQSVALKMICDREREIETFVPQEYWTYVARLSGGEPPEFAARLAKIDGKKREVGSEKEACRIEGDIRRGEFRVATVEHKESKRFPAPPFITSKLQQAAFNRFRFPVRRTMQIAQALYEGKDLGELGSVGLITYMRTDSTRIAEEALGEVRAYIERRYGAELRPDAPNLYRSKKGAQEAHEAIRPTSMELEPTRVAPLLSRDEYNLYRLIFERFVASQMRPAVFDVTDVGIANGPYEFRAQGKVAKFLGFLVAFGEAPVEESEEANGSETLPPLEDGQRLLLRHLETKQNFTQPPARYTEASLVRALEEDGIGRPSTYATILATIQTREYTYKQDGRFHPTALGRLVTDLLTRSFDDIINEKYTASLEEQLDEIEEGRLDWVEALRQFAAKFNRDLERARRQMTSVKGAGVATGEKCDRCGGEMVIKFGRFGEFLACSNYPECKRTREIAKAGEPSSSEIAPCEKCRGEMTLKRGRFGPFLACSGYPECKNIRKVGKAATPPRSTGVPCPRCQKGEIMERRSRRGKTFYGCSRYPDCDFALWNRPLPERCPRCGAAYLLEKTTKSSGTVVFCDRESCDFREGREAPAPFPEPASVAPQAD